MSLSVERYFPGVAFIGSLLGTGDPSAVFRAIISIVVYSLQPMKRGGSVANVV